MRTPGLLKTSFIALSLAGVTAAAPAQEAPAELLSAYEEYAAAVLANPSGDDPAVVMAGENLTAVCDSLGTQSVSACLDQYIAPEMRLPNDVDLLMAPMAEEPVVEEIVPEIVEEPAVEEPIEEMAPEEPALEDMPMEEAEPEPEPEVMEEPAPEAMEEQPAVEDEAMPDAEPVEEPAAEEPVAEEMPVEEPVGEEPMEPVEVIEPIEDGAEVLVEEVAPLLDSAKDSDSEASASAEAAPAEADQAAPAEEEAAAPPPEDDSAAQAEIAPQQIESVAEEEGELISEEEEVMARTSGADAPPEAEVVAKDDSGFRIIFQLGNQLILQNQDRPRLNQNASDRYVERLRNGRTRETIERPDGSSIVTIYNRNGEILRRSRFEPDGTEWVLVYVPEEREDDLLQWRDPGEDLPPLRLNIPAREYILDAEEAEEEQVIQFLDQPPVEQVRRFYSIDEVKRSARIRDMVRRLEIGGLTFDSGKATLGPDQIGGLNKVANAMLELLDENPAETFLIEGHTDAVGSAISNLELSDRRAETVAYILTEAFGIPPENLATQGYGERYLKIRTQADERRNRRVTIKRITPLVTPVAQR